MLVRRAVPGDAPEIGRVHVETWRGAYVGQLPDELLESLNIAQRAAVWGQLLLDSELDTFVAEDDGSIAGFVSLGPSRDSDADPDTGEIHSIYVLPAHWRQGIGVALSHEALSRAAERGFAELTLWVLESNQRARSFYEALGFAADPQKKYHRRSPTLVLTEVRYRCSVGKRAA